MSTISPARQNARLKFTLLLVFLRFFLWRPLLLDFAPGVQVPRRRRDVLGRNRQFLFRQPADCVESLRERRDFQELLGRVQAKYHKPKAKDE